MTADAVELVPEILPKVTALDLDRFSPANASVESEPPLATTTPEAVDVYVVPMTVDAAQPRAAPNSKVMSGIHQSLRSALPNWPVLTSPRSYGRLCPIVC
ncbi:hypothetical protein GCM10025781_26770 [Kocuria gwangalliensis]|uniref:Uncharacterized protein n=1 Tax=Kocuria gwangalliensis TaxID=501592 RepID=A0ABP8XG09_9MICC